MSFSAFGVIASSVTAGLVSSISIFPYAAPPGEGARQIVPVKGKTDIAIKSRAAILQELILIFKKISAPELCYKHHPRHSRPGGVVMFFQKKR
jgi:hypothetical protein